LVRNAYFEVIDSVERERFYQLPQSKHFLPSQTNFIFVKTKRVNSSAATAAYSDIRVTLNGGLMMFHFSIACSLATTYPTRKPANHIIRPPFNVTRISEYAAVAALEDQQYLKEVTHKNLMMFHFSIACSLATTYPTRKPANPYAFENVRNKVFISSTSTCTSNYR
jgi:hypothetical protein